MDALLGDRRTDDSTLPAASRSRFSAAQARLHRRARPAHGTSRPKERESAHVPVGRPQSSGIVPRLPAQI